MASKIWEYIEKDDPSSVKRLGKSSFNEIKYNGDTPLLSAVRHKSWKMFDAILENGGDPFYVSRFGNTLLGLLIKEGCEDRANSIFSLYMQTGQVLPSGALIDAIFSEKNEWTEKFIEKDLTIEIGDRPILPEHIIITDGKWQSFIENQAQIPDVLADSRRYFPPGSYKMLDYMALGLPKEQQDWFYSKGVPKLEEIPDDWLIMYQQIAINRKDTERCKILFDHGNRFNRDYNLSTQWAVHCFWEAINNQQWEFVNHIIDKTKDVFDIVNTKRKYVQSDVYWGNQHESVEREAHPAFKIIFKLGNLENGNEKSRMPLSVEKRDEWINRYKDALKRLLDWGMDPNLKENGWGLSLVHLAAKSNSKSALTMLADAGADFNVKSGAKNRGKTVLALLNHQKNFELASFVEGLVLKQKIGYNDMVKNHIPTAL